MNIKEIIDSLPGGLSEKERLVAANLLHELLAYSEMSTGTPRNAEFEALILQQNISSVRYLCKQLAEARVPPSFSERKPASDREASEKTPRDIIPFHEFYKAKE